MWKWIVTLFIDRIIKAIVQTIADYLARQQKKKERKEEWSEIKKIKDPVERAAAKRRFFS